MAIKPGKRTYILLNDDRLDMVVTELPGIGKINGEKLRKLGGCTKVLISVILLLILYV